MDSKNPFLKLSVLSSELWNEYKGLNWTSNKNQKVKLLAKLKKMVAEIKALDFEKEFKFIQEFHIDRSS